MQAIRQPKAKFYVTFAFGARVVIFSCMELGKNKKYHVTVTTSQQIQKYKNADARIRKVNDDIANMDFADQDRPLACYYGAQTVRELTKGKLIPAKVLGTFYTDKEPNVVHALRFAKNPKQK